MGVDNKKLFHTIVLLSPFTCIILFSPLFHPAFIYYSCFYLNALQICISFIHKKKRIRIAQIFYYLLFYIPLDFSSKFAFHFQFFPVISNQHVCLCFFFVFFLSFLSPPFSACLSLSLYLFPITSSTLWPPMFSSFLLARYYTLILKCA